MITKEEFLAAYDKFPPNAWTKTAFRYFSTNTKSEDLWLKRIVQYTLLSLFLGGFIGTIFGWNYVLVGIFTLLFGGILVLLSIFMFGAFIMNNLRIKKIRKELGGISKTEYDSLVNLYM